MYIPHIFSTDNRNYNDLFLLVNALCAKVITEHFTSDYLSLIYPAESTQGNVSKEGTIRRNLQKNFMKETKQTPKP